MGVKTVQIFVYCILNCCYLRQHSSESLKSAFVLKMRTYMLKRITVLIFLCLLWKSSQAQLDNRLISQQWQAPDTATAPGLYGGVRTLSFFKNNEFFRNLLKGYTLFGYQVQPWLSYSPSERFRIDAGLYAQKDFGNPAFTQIAPVFSLNVLHEKYTLTLGTLKGRLSHQLIEPLYEPERGLTGDLENGLQFLWHGRRLQADVWMDWQVMIYPEDPKQEEIYGGASLNYNLYQKELWRLSAPLQLTLLHKGGQIDFNPSPVVTFINAAAGLSLERSYPNSWLQSWSLKQYVTYFADDSSVPIYNFKQGNGYYANLGLKSKYLDLMLSYWKGAGYVAPKGGQLYQSVATVSVRHEALIEEHRQQLFLRLMKEFQIPGGAQLGFRITPVFDLNNNDLEMYQGVYLNYTGGFLLWKKK